MKTGFCFGCGRTKDEIALWTSYSDARAPGDHGEPPRKARNIERKPRSGDPPQPHGAGEVRRLTATFMSSLPHSRFPASVVLLFTNGGAPQLRHGRRHLRAS